MVLCPDDTRMQCQYGSGVGDVSSAPAPFRVAGQRAQEKDLGKGVPAGVRIEAAAHDMAKEAQKRCMLREPNVEVDRTQPQQRVEAAGLSGYLLRKENRH